jgi:hypothetical protein
LNDIAFEEVTSRAGLQKIYINVFSLKYNLLLKQAKLTKIKETLATKDPEVKKVI